MRFESCDRGESEVNNIDYRKWHDFNLFPYPEISYDRNRVQDT